MVCVRSHGATGFQVDPLGLWSRLIELHVVRIPAGHAHYIHIDDSILH